jgi:hypothetical protein
MCRWFIVHDLTIWKFDVSPSYRYEKRAKAGIAFEMNCSGTPKATFVFKVIWVRTV